MLHKMGIARSRRQRSVMLLVAIPLIAGVLVGLLFLTQSNKAHAQILLGITDDSRPTGIYTPYMDASGAYLPLSTPTLLCPPSWSVLTSTYPRLSAQSISDYYQ